MKQFILQLLSLLLVFNFIYAVKQVKIIINLETQIQSDLSYLTKLNINELNTLINKNCPELLHVKTKYNAKIKCVGKDHRIPVSHIAIFLELPNNANYNNLKQELLNLNIIYPDLVLSILDNSDCCIS